MDKSKSFFTTTRLEEGLHCIAGKKVREAIREIVDRVVAFCNGAEQSDDITLMMIRYYGESKRIKDISSVTGDRENNIGTPQ